MRIMIIGGHGQIALLTAPRLVRGGHHVTSVVRNPDHVADVEATGARVVVQDVEALDASGTRELVRGEDAIIWAAGAGGGSPERTYTVDRDAAIRTIDASVEVGVGRFVMVSYAGSGRDNVAEDNPLYTYAQAKAAADGHLHRAAVNWTILGPAQLTDDVRTGRIGYGDHVVKGDTSRGNVAELVAGVVGRTDLAGVTIRFRDGTTAVWEAMESMARRAAGNPVAVAREGHRVIAAAPQLALETR
ncbi:MAG: NAD(P)H-binding protein [Propionibacteriaceae bacterium]|nr:NAD(P)H-binding protein [Propionibacteriaceae bacterium]